MRSLKSASCCFPLQISPSIALHSHTQRRIKAFQREKCTMKCLLPLGEQLTWGASDMYRHPLQLIRSACMPAKKKSASKSKAAKRPAKKAPARKAAKKAAKRPAAKKAP